jgi:AMP deaminase
MPSPAFGSASLPKGPHLPASVILPHIRPNSPANATSTALDEQLTLQEPTLGTHEEIQNTQIPHVEYKEKSQPDVKKVSDVSLTAELRAMFGSLQQCLDLRDKYIRISCQRLGDNPKDHDGVFAGFKNDAGEVAGIKPDAPLDSLCPLSEDRFSPWNIYPRPPPPRWHHNTPSFSAEDNDETFDFLKCQIPKSDSWYFKMDEKGVFQVYSDKLEGNSMLFLCGNPGYLIY